jgi:hypothetical protein
LIAAGQLSNAGIRESNLTAFAADGTVVWQRTSQVVNGFGGGQLNAIAVDETRSALYAVGVVQNNPTGADMLAIGVSNDGAGLPSAVPNPKVTGVHVSKR